MTRTTAIRAGGTALAVGGPVWATTLLTTGPPVDGVSPRAEVLGGLAWQAGVAGLLLAVALTGASGRGRAARVTLAVEAVLLAAAAVWSVVYAIDPASQRTVVMAVLDAAWPLSVLGLLPVGVLVLRAGVWPAPLRQLPLVAALWLPLDLVATLAVGESAGLALRVAWLAVVWGGLGLLLAVRAPEEGRSGHDAAAQQRAHRSP